MLLVDNLIQTQYSMSAASGAASLSVVVVETGQ